MTQEPREVRSGQDIDLSRDRQPAERRAARQDLEHGGRPVGPSPVHRPAGPSGPPTVASTRSTALWPSTPGVSVGAGPTCFDAAYHHRLLVRRALVSPVSRGAARITA